MKDYRKRNAPGPGILTFLDQHRLDHSPEHYAFVYDYLAGVDLELRAKVDSVIEGGCRLTEDRLRRIRAIPKHGDVPASSVPHLNQVTVRVLGVVGDAMTAMNDLNRDLVGASAALLNGGSADIGPMITAMVERTERAEASLADAARRAREIRTDLAALRDNGLRDELTGLPNGEVLEGRIEAATSGSGGCLALIDVDGLGQINDCHTSTVGDRLLAAVATVLTEACGSSFVARLEGGTFAVLIEGTDLVSAARLIERVRNSMALRKMKVRESAASLGSVTISAGIATSRGRHPPAVIEAARIELQRAKAAGRNRVICESSLIDVSGPAA